MLQILEIIVFLAESLQIIFLQFTNSLAQLDLACYYLQLRFVVLDSLFDLF